MKIIAITQRVDKIENYNEVRDALDQNWSKFFEKINAAIVPIPNCPKVLDIILERVKPDAIVLTGGTSPIYYGGISPERDYVDDAMIQYAVNKRIPLLGVCRGMQSIVLHFNGTLKRVEGHVASQHDLQGDICRKVNSYHSYAVDTIGNELMIKAVAEDGIIEAVMHAEYPIYGIMWHPERIEGFDKTDMEFIKSILKL